MRFIHIPHFFVPEGTQILSTPEEIAEHTHQWQLCSTCSYLLCSCGNCHNSRQCNEICLHDEKSDD